MGQQIIGFVRYGVRGVPTLLIFDGRGNLVEQSVGVPNRKDIVAQVLDLINLS